MKGIPITYDPGVFAGITFEDIDNALIWEQRETAPRMEAYYAVRSIPYTYGSGAGERTYMPHVFDPGAAKRDALYRIWMTPPFQQFELLFCNRYADQHNALGWHADDSPSIDHTRPIVVVTFGAERDIWFRPLDAEGKIPKGTDGIEKLTLGHGSVLVMHPGMQQTHVHRIPKHDRPCGPRISLTFRGLAKDAAGYEDKH